MESEIDILVGWPSTARYGGTSCPSTSSIRPRSRGGSPESGVARRDDGHAVVEEAIEEGDRGRVLGEEPTRVSKGQWDANPSEGRS